MPSLLSEKELPFMLAAADAARSSVGTDAAAAAKPADRKNAGRLIIEGKTTTFMLVFLSA
jgi:hypothetical protein